VNLATIVLAPLAIIAVAGEERAPFVHKHIGKLLVGLLALLAGVLFVHLNSRKVVLWLLGWGW
jgi:hypothetical protein